MNSHKPQRLNVVEIIGAVTAVGSLLVGVATLSISARVSDLEDYFHSEIEHRNSELKNSQNAKAALEMQRLDLERATRQQEAQLGRIQAQASGATIEAVSALRRQQEAMARLSEITSRMATANQKLLVAEANLDVTLRKQTYQLLSSSLVWGLLRDRLEKDDRNDAYQLDAGQTLLATISRLRDEGRNRAIAPMLNDVNGYVVRNCPELTKSKISLARLGPMPALPDIPASKSENEYIIHRNQAYAAWSKSLKQYDDTRDLREKTYAAEIEKFERSAKECICHALVSGHAQDDICQELTF